MGDEEDTTLFVGNLHDKVTEEILFELFLQVGPIASVRIPIKDGIKKNFGFIQFKHYVSIPYTLEAMRGIQLYGRELKINHRGSNERKEGNRQNNQSNHEKFSPLTPPNQMNQQAANALMMYGQTPTRNGQCPPQLMSPPAPPHMQQEMNGEGRDGQRGDRDRRDRDRSDRGSTEGRRRSRSRSPSGRRHGTESDQGYDSSPHGGDSRHGRDNRGQWGDGGRDGEDGDRGRDGRGRREFGSSPNGFIPMNNSPHPFSPPMNAYHDRDFQNERERVLQMQNQMFQQRGMARGGFHGGGRGNWDRGGGNRSRH